MSATTNWSHGARGSSREVAGPDFRTVPWTVGSGEVRLQRLARAAAAARRRRFAAAMRGRSLRALALCHQPPRKVFLLVSTVCLGRCSSL